MSEEGILLTSLMFTVILYMWAHIFARIFAGVFLYIKVGKSWFVVAGKDSIINAKFIMKVYDQAIFENLINILFRLTFLTI